MTTTLLEPGVYRHYKGQYYQVLGVVTHSETMETLVLYRALYGEFGLWVRPLAMFTEHVMLDGQAIQRFAFVSATRPFEIPAPPLSFELRA